MKIISLTCALLLLLISHALAISPINGETIKEAQHYGKINAQHHLKDFLQPWISYEEKAENLDDTAEYAYLYTTFLLIATDAREKILNDQSISLLDSERIVADYKDTLSFSIVLFSDKEDFAKNARVIIKQDKKVIKAYQVNMPFNAEKIVSHTEQTLFKIQWYVYFLEKNIKLDVPVKLFITTSGNRGHSFYYDLGKIK